MTRRSAYVFIVVAWIAVMFGATAAAVAGPFDNMVGCWNGTATLYDPQGLPQGGVVTSTGSVRWTTPGKVMHFKQVQGGGVLEYDLDVNGKVASFKSTDKDVTGTQIRSGYYFFQLNFKTGPQAGNWYNNHYFTGSRSRMVLGSFEPAGSHGQTSAIAMQRLKKVSCYRVEQILTRAKVN
jgi:hypothetical protein